jgi:hypothetical protein
VARRLERPEPAGRLPVDAAVGGAGDPRRHRLVARVGGTAVDPALEVVDDGLGQPAGWGHLERLVAERGHDEAGGRVTRHDRRTAVAAGLPAGRPVEQQAAPRLVGLGGVAFEAVRDEDRPDAGLEEGDVGRGLRTVGRRCPPVPDRREAGSHADHGEEDAAAPHVMLPVSPRQCP